MEISDEPPEDGEGFSAATLEAHARHKDMLSRMEQKWRSRQIVVPTNDRLVMLRLRELGDPIILFGENPEDRRERLRDLLARLGIEQGMPTGARVSAASGTGATATPADGEAYSTEGSTALRNTRRWLMRQTLHRARARVAEQHRASEDTAGRAARDRETQETWAAARAWRNVTSQVGDDRPLSGCAFSPDGSLIATSSWSGLAKLWSASDCCMTRSYAGHRERVQGIAFHPLSCISQDRSSVNLATASADNDVMLWSLESSTPLATLRGHSQRANRVAFHPCGRLLASTSTDCTWRLWNLDTGVCLLEQDGHSRPVFGAAFQCDGSLLATGSADAYVRIWDLRSGACACTLEGHVRDVIAVDWSPNGYHLVSGGEDHTIRMWDLRKKKTFATIPAHKALVSSLRLDRGAGDVMVSSGFDNCVKVWGIRKTKWKLLTSIEGHEGKIISMDYSRDLSRIVTAAYDRTWKLWEHETPKAEKPKDDAGMAVDS